MGGRGTRGQSGGHKRAQVTTGGVRGHNGWVQESAAGGGAWRVGEQVGTREGPTGVQEGATSGRPVRPPVIHQIACPR